MSSRVCADREAAVSEAMELAQLMASKSPVAVQGSKVNLNYSRDHTVQEGLDFAVRDLVSVPDHMSWSLFHAGGMELNHAPIGGCGCGNCSIYSEGDASFFQTVTCVLFV